MQGFIKEELRMKINKEIRKEIWDRYSDLEFQIRDLKGIVQNDIELSEKDLEIHIQLTNKAIIELHELSVMIQKECR